MKPVATPYSMRGRRSSQMARNRSSLVRLPARKGETPTRKSVSAR